MKKIDLLVRPEWDPKCVSVSWLKRARCVRSLQQTLWNRVHGCKLKTKSFVGVPEWFERRSLDQPAFFMKYCFIASNPRLVNQVLPEHHSPQLLINSCTIIITIFGSGVPRLCATSQCNALQKFYLTMLLLLLSQKCTLSPFFSH